MGSAIRIIIADNSFISRKGLAYVIGHNQDMELVAESENVDLLMDALMIHRPEVLILDYTCPGFPTNLVKQINKKYPRTKMLAITTAQTKQQILNAMSSGIISYLLKECDQQEIEDAIRATAKGEKFFCAKVLNVVTDETNLSPVVTETSCEGVTISDREAEIIRLVAEGFSNKQIADKLFLSMHTVTTHRKNIMAKLNINNTAGLVMYAVRQNILGPNHFLFSSNN